MLVLKAMNNCGGFQSKENEKKGQKNERTQTQPSLSMDIYTARKCPWIYN